MSQENVYSFAELRNHLPVEPMEPSAPIYTIESEFPAEDEDNKDQLALCKRFPEDGSDEKELYNNSSEKYSAAESLKINKIELDVKKARLRKEQLEKERKLVDEDFTIRIELVDTEIATYVEKWKSYQESLRATPAKSGLSHNDNQNQTIEGLEQLRSLDNVSIRQLRSHGVLPEVYEVVVPGEDQVIFKANVTVGLEGKKRVLSAVFIDSQVNEVITFQKGQGKGMELLIGGELVSRVQKKPTFFKPMFQIFDSHGTPVLKLKGGRVQDGVRAFHLQTLEKLNIGLLDKRSVQPTAQYDVNHATIQFPPDLDPHYKAAVIAANFLILSEKIGEIRKQKIEALVAESKKVQEGQDLKKANYPRH